jgi:hypothetical protein
MVREVFPQLTRQNVDIYVGPSGREGKHYVGEPKVDSGIKYIVRIKRAGGVP